MHRGNRNAPFAGGIGPQRPLNYCCSCAPFTGAHPSSKVYLIKHFVIVRGGFPRVRYDRPRFSSRALVRGKHIKKKQKQKQKKNSLVVLASDVSFLPNTTYLLLGLLPPISGRHRKHNSRGAPKPRFLPTKHEVPINWTSTSPIQVLTPEISSLVAIPSHGSFLLDMHWLSSEGTKQL